jgi:hypothetical protein
VGFDPTIAVLEWAKTVRAVDRSATAIGFAKYKQNNQVKEDEVGGACSRMGEKRNSYRLLVGKPEGKGPLGRSRRGWVHNIKMDRLEIGWGGVD